MKAVNQIPQTEVKTERQRQPTELKADTLWAMLRRLNARVANLELQVSTCRRDINRVDRNYYREREKLPSDNAKQPPVDDLNALLYGGR